MNDDLIDKLNQIYEPIRVAFSLADKLELAHPDLFSADDVVALARISINIRNSIRSLKEKEDRHHADFHNSL